MDVMGLDMVEHVLRAEDVFSVDLPDDDCASIRTVGDLYGLILNRLALPYISSIEIETKSMGLARPRQKALQLTSWTTPDVWLTLKCLVHEDLGVEPSRINEAAFFVDHLGVD